MKAYSVPVSYVADGFITVKASSPEDAIIKARAKYSSHGRDCIEAPTVEVDFASGDDPGAVEETHGS